MPRFPLPRKSARHRAAAIALYRALLSRCSSAPLPNELRIGLRNTIQNKFRQNRKLFSPYQLGVTFRAGYETLDHLDAASNGDAASISFLTSFIPKLPRGVARSPPARYSRSIPKPPNRTLECLPPPKKVLNVRPYKHVSGPRHVPILTSANGIPFLRIKKPQPASLSRVLGQKLRTYDKILDNKVLLENYHYLMGQYEEDWDALLAVTYGVTSEGGGQGEPSWVDAVKLAREANQMWFERSRAKDRATARKMQAIVDKETALAIRGGQEISRGRSGRRKSKVLFP